MRRWAWLLLVFSALVEAHPLAPALLDLRETGAATYTATLRTSVIAARGVTLAPRWPDDCVARETLPPSLVDGEAVQQAWAVQCARDLFGRELAVTGLDVSGINLVLRSERRDGAVAQRLVDGDATRAVIAVPGQADSAMLRYLGLGVFHLLTGPDHLLFIVGLMLLVPTPRRLVWTLTAFTLGHSLTLSAATLGLVRLNPALMELAIAASLLVLAVQAGAPAASGARALRRPALYAAAFGLLHGLGFAGALAGIGLPQREIPLALLAFNVGIEIAQVGVVALLLGASALLRAGRAKRLAAAALPHGAARVAAVYAIGSLAAYWCFERAAVLVQ